MTTVTVALHAMATRFELVLHGDEPARLRAAGEEALREIERLEALLSLFRPSSEISRLNAFAGQQPVTVSPEVFALLQQAQRLSEETGGTFDITIAPLMRCWGFRDGDPRVPSPPELAVVRRHVGMGLVLLHPENRTVEFAREGVRLDLGAIGKGYAIECAVGLLRDAGITSALLHGGTSTVYGLGRTPEGEAWKIALEHPRVQPERGLARRQQGPNSPGLAIERRIDPPGSGGRCGREDPRCDSSPGTPFATVSLVDEALSVSAIWGRFFKVDGTSYGHIIDPRTGRPAQAALLAAVALPCATETDALSTALLTLGPPGHDQIARLRPGMRTLVVGEGGGAWRVEAQGLTPSTY